MSSLKCIWIMCFTLVCYVGPGASVVFTDPLEKKITGTIKQIQGDMIILENYEEFEPANEYINIPKWVKPGQRVKIGYYIQKEIQYYLEIVKEGQKLNTEVKLHKFKI